MADTTIQRRRGGRRALASALAAAWIFAGLSGVAGATTLQDAFAPGYAFEQDGLTFSAFTPVLNDTLPSVDDVLSQAMVDPNGLTSLSVFDFSTGVFSKGTGNAAAADAGNITLDILSDDTSTSGIDPGFRLNGNGEWKVDAGYSTPADPSDDIASAQLSAFAYTVTTGDPVNQPITSADLDQFSVIDAVGPDVFSLFPFSVPDVAAGFNLQFILNPGSTDLAGALMNYTLESGVQTSGGVVPLPFDQSMDWEGFTGVGAIQVVSVVGLGATSEGGFTMSALEQRIDPPQPAIPEPGTWLLLGVGMLGVGYMRRARSKP